VVRVDDPLAVRLEARNRAHDGARGDDDVARVDGLLLPVLAFDDNFAGQSEPARALERRDLVLLHQELYALRVLRHDLVLALLHVGEGELHAGDLHAEVREPVLRLLVVVRRHQQLFRRDAAAQGARPAQALVLLHERDLEAELRAADRRHVPAGSAADNRHVELFSSQCPLLEWQVTS
jgi:hypothetical protein